MKQHISFRGGLVALGMTALLAAPAYAESFTPPNFSVMVNGTLFDSGMLGLTEVPDDPGTFNTTGFSSQAEWDFGWDLNVNPDPIIGGSFSVTNTTGADQDFNFAFNLPTNETAPASIQQGEVTFTLSDTDASGGVELTSFDWAGLIDGSNALSILSVTSGSCFFTSCSVTVGPQSNGPLPGPGYTSTIGILISFTLSAGDTVEFDTFYEVNPVPLPAGLPLLLSAGGVLALLRRRRA